MAEFDQLSNTEDLIKRITRARLETKQLYQQIDKVKQKIQDSTLIECSKQVPSISSNRSSLNLKPLQVLKGHNHKIADLRWSHDSKTILSCSQDGFLIVWDPSSGLKLNAIPLDSQWVLACAYSSNGKLVASGGLTNNCTIYLLPSDPNDAFQQRIVTVFKGHVCGITAVEFVDNETVVTASGDMTCALWDVNKSRRIGQYLDHFGDVLSLDVEKQRNIFVSGASDGYARIWDSRTNDFSAQQSFFVSNSDITSLKFFKDGNSFVTGSDDGIIRMYDLRTDGELSKYSIYSALQEQSNVIRDQTFFDQGNATYSESPNYSQQAFSLSKNYSISDQNSALDASGVTSLDFSSSGRLLYSCYSDQGCVIWDLLKGEISGNLTGHTNRVVRVSSSPNGLGVVTGSWDTTMRVYTPSYV